MYNALALYLPGVFLGGGSSTSFSELFPSDSSAEDSWFTRKQGDISCTKSFHKHHKANGWK